MNKAEAFFKVSLFLQVINTIKAADRRIHRTVKLKLTHILA